jgi:hypothetical protein
MPNLHSHTLYDSSERGISNLKHELLRLGSGVTSHQQCWSLDMNEHVAGLCAQRQLPRKITSASSAHKVAGWPSPVPQAAKGLQKRARASHSSVGCMHCDTSQ